MGVGQLGVALLDRDADVHVLGPLFFSSKLEVAVGAGEVQDHQIVVLGEAARAVGISVQT